MNARKFLLQSAYTLCERRPIEKITLKELLQEADVSKPTFYRYYHDKYELVNDLYDRLTQAGIICPESVVTADDWKRMYLTQFAAFRKHRAVIQHLYGSRETGCTIEYEIKRTVEFDMAYLHKKGVDTEQPRIRFAVEAKDVGGTYMMRDWILGGMVTEDREMVERFQDIIPHLLVPYYIE